MAVYNFRSFVAAIADFYLVFGGCGARWILILRHAPAFYFTENARQHLIYAHLGATVTRDFLQVQIGNAAPQIVAEVNWSLDTKAYFTANEPNQSTLTVQDGLYTPPPNQTFYGGTPVDTPIEPRTNTANGHDSNPQNWIGSGPAGSFAPSHPCPLP
jgi:hypothetical protein